jgi:hypothetical protein
VAEDIVPSDKVYVYAYRADLGESFAGPVQFSQGEPRTGSIDVFLQRAGLEVAVVEGEKRLEDIEISLDNDLVWGWVPPGMNLNQWYRQRTSMDISRYSRNLSLIPGSRECVQGDGQVCRFTDLQAATYSLVIFHMFNSHALKGWEQEYWAYLGTLDQPLLPLEVRPLRLSLDLGRKVKGQVVDAGGKGLPDLRVQVYFDIEIPGLKEANGYTVTHSGAEGWFEAVGVGPGPYRVTAGDRQDRIAGVKGVPENPDHLQIVWKFESEPRKE